jgi:hypothetical protein
VATHPKDLDLNIKTGIKLSKKI